MASTSTALFRKLRTCPRPETLLAYCLGARSGAPGERVAEHVASCDFCGAEVQLLSRHAPPAGALPLVVPPMPTHLRRLAEDLLAEQSYDPARFADSLVEPDRLTLTDA